MTSRTNREEKNYLSNPDGQGTDRERFWPPEFAQAQTQRRQKKEKPFWRELFSPRANNTGKR